MVGGTELHVYSSFTVGELIMPTLRKTVGRSLISNPVTLPGEPPVLCLVSPHSSPTSPLTAGLYVSLFKNN